MTDFTIPQCSEREELCEEEEEKKTLDFLPFDFIGTLRHKEALCFAMDSKVTLWIDHNVRVAIVFVHGYLDCNQQ